MNEPFQQTALLAFMVDCPDITDAAVRELLYQFMIQYGFTPEYLFLSDHLYHEFNEHIKKDMNVDAQASIKMFMGVHVVILSTLPKTRMLFSRLPQDVSLETVRTEAHR